MFEHGRIALQILTSDFGACPADILSWLKSRWREENFLKYASVNYGIDKICDYLAAIEVNTKIVDNPARKAATAAVREAEKILAGAEQELAGLLTDPAITPAVKNGGISVHIPCQRGHVVMKASLLCRDSVGWRVTGGAGLAVRGWAGSRGGRGS